MKKAVLYLAIFLIIGIFIGYLISSNIKSYSKVDNSELKTRQFELRGFSSFNSDAAPNFHFNEESCKTEFMNTTDIVTGKLKSLDCKITTVNTQVLNAHLPKEGTVETSAQCWCDFLIDTNS